MQSMIVRADQLTSRPADQEIDKAHSILISTEMANFRGSETLQAKQSEFVLISSSRNLHYDP
jgi:hypothetical protein